MLLTIGAMNRDQLKKLERDLWSAADKLRANSDLKASEYSTPVLGLIFLKFADNKYRQHEDAILAEYQKLKGTRRERTLQEIAIERCGFALGPFAPLRPFAESSGEGRYRQGHPRGDGQHREQQARAAGRAAAGGVRPLQPQ